MCLYFLFVSCLLIIEEVGCHSFPLIYWLFCLIKFYLFRAGTQQESYQDWRRVSVHAKQLPALQVHDVVAIQDPTGHPRRWSKTGKIIEALDHDSYMVTKRNGQFLRKLGLYQADTDIFDPNASSYHTSCPCHWCPWPAGRRTWRRHPWLAWKPTWWRKLNPWINNPCFIERECGLYSPFHRSITTSSAWPLWTTKPWTCYLHCLFSDSNIGLV